QQLGCELGAKIFRLEQLANFDFCFCSRGRVGTALHQIDGLLLRLHLPDPEASPEFLGLTKRPVSHTAFAPCTLNAHALASRGEPGRAARGRSPAPRSISPYG